VPFLNIVNIVVLARHAGGRRASPAVVAVALVRNPLLWAIVVGIALNVAGIGLWEPAARALDLVGRAALGVSLLALGAGLSWQALKMSGREVAVASAVKLLATPLAAFGWAAAFDVTGQSLVVMMVAAAVPTAVNGYVLARAMGGDAELYAAALTAQVVISFLTLPVFVWLAGNAG